MLEDAFLIVLCILLVLRHVDFFDFLGLHEVFGLEASQTPLLLVAIRFEQLVYHIFGSSPGSQVERSDQLEVGSVEVRLDQLPRIHGLDVVLGRALDAELGAAFILDCDQPMVVPEGSQTLHVLRLYKCRELQLHVDLKIF